MFQVAFKMALVISVSWYSYLNIIPWSCVRTGPGNLLLINIIQQKWCDFHFSHSFFLLSSCIAICSPAVLWLHGEEVRELLSAASEEHMSFVPGLEESDPANNHTGSSVAGALLVKALEWIPALANSSAAVWWGPPGSQKTQTLDSWATETVR